MEFWALAGLAVGSQVIGGAMQSRASRRAAADENKYTIEQMRERGVQDRETLRYQGELGNYWQKRQTQDRRNARGAMFDKYSSIAKPQGYTRPDLYTGEAPIANPKPATTTPAIGAPTNNRRG